MSAIEQGQIEVTDRSGAGTDRQCFVCAKPIVDEGQPYNDSGWTDYGIFQGLSVFHCQSCGFGFSAPELSGQAVGLFYEKQYRSKHSTYYIDFKKSVPRRVGDVSGDRAFAQLVLARAHCRFDAGEVFLDIGPGKGGSFKLAGALLPCPQLCAVELSDGAAEFYSQNYDALTYSSLANFIATGRRAKFLLMSHSLEHYRRADLAELFPVLGTALADDGVLIVEVPHTDLRVHSEVRGMDTPHFLFFSKESLARMLAKFGFEVVFIDTCGQEYSGAEQKMIAASQSSKSRKHLKRTYNKLPLCLQAGLRIFVRNIQRAKNIALNPRTDSTVLPIQSYGGNRNCLRLVARKNPERS